MTDTATIGTQPWTEALGHVIKVRRTDLEIRRQDLATMAGISYSHLTAIENGTRAPSTKVLGVIAACLGLNMTDLLALVGDRLARSTSPDPYGFHKYDTSIAPQRDPDRETPPGEWRRTDPPPITTDRQKLAELLDSLDDSDIPTLIQVAEGLSLRRSSTII